MSHHGINLCHNTIYIKLIQPMSLYNIFGILLHKTNTWHVMVLTIKGLLIHG